MTASHIKVKSDTINAAEEVNGVRLSTEYCYKPRWLDPNGLEAEYGFSKSSQAKMRMLSNSSTIPFSKIGKYIRYDRHLIDTWLSSHQVQGVA